MGETFDFEDIFGDVFGRGRSSWGTVGGADQEAEVVITLDEAYRGGRRTITLTGPTGPRTLEVTIPAGVADGQRIRLAGQGGGGRGGGPAGDLYLIVRLAPHPRYRVEARNVFVDLSVSSWEAALGASVPIDTPTGEATVRVPAGSSCGRRLRLRHRGIPNSRGEAGDLFAVVQIKMSRTVSDDERRLYEELAKTSSFDPRARR
jgi:curved DNA-binding protein